MDNPVMSLRRKLGISRLKLATLLRISYGGVFFAETGTVKRPARLAAALKAAGLIDDEGEFLRMYAGWLDSTGPCTSA